jgi:hypothetical protein
MNNITKHAKKRMRQRGVPLPVLELIVKYGNHRPAPGGATAVGLTNQFYQLAIQELKSSIQFLDKAKNHNIIIKDNSILTVV